MVYGSFEDAERAADEFDKLLLVGDVERMRQVKSRTAARGDPFHSEMTVADALQHLPTWLLRREIRLLDNDMKQVQEATKTLDRDVKEVHKATTDVDAAAVALEKSSLHLESLTRRLVWLTVVLAVATVSQVLLSILRFV